MRLVHGRCTLRGYHDDEGVPIRDDRQLFGLLEGFQAGLSWITILRKREHFDRVFDAWDPDRIAAYGPEKIEELMADPGIIRNRLKIEGAVKMPMPICVFRPGRDRSAITCGDSSAKSRR